MSLLQTNKQHGFTLVEIMVSLVIGLIISAGIFQIFMSNNQSYRSSNALAHLQESGRIGIRILSSAIRSAGYQGCADPRTIGANTVANDPPTATLFANTLRGYEFNEPMAWAPDDLIDIQALATVASDVITIQHGSDESVSLAIDMATKSDPVNISSDNLEITAGEMLLISDCDSADLFRASALADTVGDTIDVSHTLDQNSSNDLNKPYTTRASVMRFRSDAYFVADTGRINAIGDITSALFRRDASGNIVELVEGVENMQILYGEFDDTTNLTRYVAADTVDLDLSKVISIRVGLLVHSIEPALDQNDTRTYNLAGTQIPPDDAFAVPSHPIDRRMRRTFTTTIELRNRS